MKPVFILILSLFPFLSKAQGSVEVVMSPELEQIIARAAVYHQETDERNGYRIQILYSSVRDDVYKEKASLYKEFPEIPSYVDYEQPHYKLKLGNFSTRLEATFYLQQVIASRPGAFIVRDRIKSN